MSLTVSILGAGESGVGAALLAQAKGCKVFLSDYGKIAGKYRQILADHLIEFEEEQHSWERLSIADLVIKSPGIPGNVPIVKSLREKGLPVISEIEFASRFTSAKVIAITGTNGKTTTTLLTHHLLKSAGLNVGVGGNIGNSFATLVIEDQFDYYVLEISSFQLDDIAGFKPDIAMILNVTPDHLDRYDYDFRKYLQSKLRIAENQQATDLLIYNYDDESLKAGVKELVSNVQLKEISVATPDVSGGFVKGDHFFFGNAANLKLHTDSSPLYGKHNQANALFAMTAAASLGLSEEEIRAGLRSFRNAPHRMEMVADIKGVSYINDSKATNVDAVYFALEGIKKKIVWIAGGVDKGNEYQQILELVHEKVECMVCLGKDNSQLIKAFGHQVERVEEVLNMHEAVRRGSLAAREGQVVLLSPACASFDLFNDYEDRGDQFREEVLKLKEGKE